MKATKRESALTSPGLQRQVLGRPTFQTWALETSQPPFSTPTNGPLPQMTDLEYLADVVAEGADGIDLWVAQHLHHAGAVCLQEPLLDGLELALLRDDDALLVILLRQVHVHLSAKR